MDQDKNEIIDLFNKNVKGRLPDTGNSNEKHDGKEGHWLERQMNIKANGNNAPDLLGYEMKNQTTSKTTFGDWSANYYIFKGKTAEIKRDDFLKIFGKPNALKNNRFSWSGEPCPRIDRVNNFGQILHIDEENNIIAFYHYSADQRTNKDKIIPKQFQIDNLILAKWNAESIKKKLERKFNQKGWFKCVKGNDGTYQSIHFGDPINYDNWIELVKKGSVFFDSGMYQGNIRPYSQWRANNSLWEELITSKY
jgi:hypothetical protein